MRLQIQLPQTIPDSVFDRRRFFGGGGSSGKVQQVEKLTPAQEQLVSLLVQQATPAVRGVTGATIPGQEFAPGGPGPLQQQAFDFAGGPGFGAFQQSIQPFGGEQFTQQVGGPLSAFTQQQFQQETIPAIASAVGFGGGARSSGFQDILAREGRNLGLGINAQLAPLAFGAQQQALGRQFGAAQGIGGFAQLGAAQQAFPEAQRQFALQQFQAGAPEADPRLGFVGPAFTSPYDTAVQQGTYGPSVFSQIAGPAAALGAGYLAGGGTNLLGLGISDKRLKENIKPIDNALEKLSKLDGKVYKFKFKDTERDGGVIAQDLEKILPEAVIEINSIKYVKYEAVIALLVSAVNELARKVA